MTTRTPASHAANVPALGDILRGLVLAGYVFVVTFLTGIISHGLDIDHLSNATHAAEAAIAALLAGIGFGAYTAVEHSRHHEEPAVIISDYPPDPHLPNP
jgi:hypothetical protein